MTTVPKKRISSSKKRIRKNLWKGKGHSAALKAFSLGKSLSTGNSKSFCRFFSMPTDINKIKRILNGEGQNEKKR
uniref:Ribosomal protein L32 n=2 Tax=Pelargonium TaxID=4030 RepID=B7T481_9ROSI|nr:ribosomal protein L32 [Pelargonium cotyledonis]YP_009171310.1 ribosomal protein L32 [Pelargonium cotyledonis]YP_009171393.1 ribosomal protein L32 [Pelargonium australe]YP_009171407.1 ribosomal protein L32 [Pelargonium australe]ACH47391.1 ribosomal protein L32 [Pelargonium cotyledonis]AJA38503.1 ribosomal protein L32 [Pelargonium cotyledonis]AJA38516.1 ribosomal protein L32 [Pelargonium cotyledonis]AJA38599.1 ribosomal protein L32 [Pelargonium australe]AJA38613.1 ribosomal protein L32 [Pe